MTINKPIIHNNIVDRASENGRQLQIELQCISKMVPQGGTYSSRTTSGNTKLPGAPKIHQGHLFLLKLTRHLPNQIIHVSDHFFQKLL